MQFNQIELKCKSILLEEKKSHLANSMRQEQNKKLIDSELLEKLNYDNLRLLNKFN